MGEVHRIDPGACGCTDCLTGRSVPLGSATRGDILAMARGQVANATGHDLTAQVTYRLGDRTETVVPGTVVPTRSAAVAHPAGGWRDGDCLVAQLGTDATMVTDASACIVLITPGRRITVSNAGDWAEALTLARIYQAGPRRPGGAGHE